MHHDLIGHTSFAKSAPPCDRFVSLPIHFPPSAHQPPAGVFPCARCTHCSSFGLVCAGTARKTRADRFFSRSLFAFIVVPSASWEKLRGWRRKLPFLAAWRAANGAPCSLILWSCFADLSYVNESFYRILPSNSHF